MIDGIHHVTQLTSDMDRLIGFYERLFDAQVTLDMEEEGLRHAFIELGPNIVLHPFQIPGVEPPPPQPVFSRGRLDHFAVHAESEEAFWRLRDRVVAEGAGDGVVADMGSLLNLGYTDPDGGEHEIVWVRPGVPVERGIRRAEWTYVQPD